MTPPKGFTEETIRKELAGRLRNMVDSFEASVSSRFLRYNLAQDVYDNIQTLSSLEFIEDYTAYNFPLLKTRVDSLVQNVCGGYTTMSPYWIVKSGKNEDDREAAETDLTKAFELAGFDLKVRQMGKVAALKARGPCRLTYQTIREGEFCDTQGAGDGEVVYSGLVIDPIRAERFVLYPTYAPNPSKALMVGHWFEEPAIEVYEKQKDGVYLDDWVIGPQDDSGETDDDRTPTVVDNSWDAPVRIYDTIVTLRPGDPNLTEDTGKPKPRRWYRVIWAYNQQEILHIEEYDSPTPNYFAPGFDEEIDEFYPEHSPASRLFEMQAVVNDAESLKIFGGAQAAFPTIFASGFVAEAQTVRYGIGQVVAYKGSPTFTTIPSNFDPRASESAATDAERYADGVNGATQMGAGQAPKGDPTATEVNIVAQGAAASMSEQRIMFGNELVRMAKYALHLLATYWKDWKKHNDIEAKSKKAYQDRYTLEINGKTAGNSPDVVMQKVKALMETAQALGIPFTPPESAINPTELLSMVINALEFHVSSSKIVVEQYAEPPITDQAINPGAGGPTPEEAQLLEALLNGGGQGVPPGLPQDPTGGAIPADIPPELVGILQALAASGAVPGA